MTRLVLACVVVIERSKTGAMRWVCEPCNKRGPWRVGSAIAVRGGELHVLLATNSKESM